MLNNEKFSKSSNPCRIKYFSHRQTGCTTRWKRWFSYISILRSGGMAGSRKRSTTK